MVTPTPIRSGTKATPQAVFAACDQLRAELGDFNVDDVIAITKGSRTTVGRLVKMYFAHEPMIAANDALDAEITINLVQALDQLLKQQLQRSQHAIEDFKRSTGQEIVELSETLEDQQEEIGELNEQNDRLRAQLKELEANKVQLETKAADQKRELAERTSQLTLKTDELKATQDAHAAKLEQLGSTHQHQLTTALETQRQAMNAEHAQALEQRSTEHKQQLQDAREDTDKAITEKRKAVTALEKTITEREESIAELNAQLHEQTITLTTTQSDLRGAKQRAEENITRLNALVEEKQQAVDQAQSRHRELLTSIDQRLSSNTLDVTQTLATVSDATDNVNTTLLGMATLLQELQASANALKPEQHRDDTRTDNKQ